jgi:hypothetical protein
VPYLAVAVATLHIDHAAHPHEHGIKAPKAATAEGDGLQEL